MYKSTATAAPQADNFFECLQSACREDYGQFYDGKWILPSLWLGLWNFASPGFSMIGAIIGGFLQDWHGRRISLAVGSLVSALSVIMLFLSNRFDDIEARRIMFLMGKGVQGGAIGIVMATTQTYMSEILPPVLRGSVLAFFSVFILLGQLIGAVVIYACLNIDDGYIICFATQWPFSAIPFIMAFIIPESPTYLIRKGKFDQAFNAQQRLDSPGMDTQANVDQLRRDIEHEREKSEATYLQCFNKANIRRTMIVVIANTVPNFFGLALLSKSAYYLQVLGMEADISLMLLILGIICGLLSNMVSIWVLSLFGRRFLSLSSLIGVIIVWSSQGIAGFWPGETSMR